MTHGVLDREVGGPPWEDLEAFQEVVKASAFLGHCPWRHNFIFTTSGVKLEWNPGSNGKGVQADS
jgi:hypothetical protein